MQKLGDLLSERALAHFTGREREVDTLLRLFETGGPLVVHVHGVAGIGKSSLLEAFAGRARAQGIRVIRIDCRTVEPTARGLLAELSDALGESLASVEAVAQRLTSLGETVAIVLDTHEVFVLLDTWLRQVFVPSLPSERAPRHRKPQPAVTGVADDAGLARTLPKPAARPAAGYGCAALSRFVGHPDGRRATNQRHRARSSARVEHVGLDRALGRWPQHRRHQPASRDRRAVALVHRGRAGRDHEAGARSECRGPTRHRAATSRAHPRHRSARCDGAPGRAAVRRSRARGAVHPRSCAWRDRQQPGGARSRYASGVPSRGVGLPAEQVRHRHGAEPWRYTADLLFLLENPVLREGFFPSGAQPLAVEPSDTDGRAGCAPSRSAKAAPERDALAAWWRITPMASACPGS